MIGTFNVRVPGLRIEKFTPSVVREKKRYWFVKLYSQKENKTYLGWAIRDIGSRQCENVLEVLTKRRLPESLKQGDFDVGLPVKWSKSYTKQWADQQYWFQTFPFSPIKKADSEKVWKTIDCIDWSGLDVLDYGCHYGYYSFAASGKGAVVHGVDKSSKSISIAQEIRDHIIHQDVTFSRANTILTGKQYDVVMYLSVHHQIDKDYKRLAETIDTLLTITKKYLFIELILPPTFPKDHSMTEESIDILIGGKILLKYKHYVRGERAIYLVRQ
jgi:SAM-dependent methyltransferase